MSKPEKCDTNLGDEKVQIQHFNNDPENPVAGFKYEKLAQDEFRLTIVCRPSDKTYQSLEQAHREFLKRVREFRKKKHQEGRLRKDNPPSTSVKRKLFDSGISTNSSTPGAPKND